MTPLTVLSNRIKVSRCNAKGWDTGSNGQYTETDNEIKIKTGLTKEVELLTLCHELNHVGESLLGINFNESQIQQLGLLWYSIIKDNPEFLELFSEVR